jgi:hypothetical protein
MTGPIERQLTIVGRAEKISLPALGAKNVPAKIDTGADSSSIWAHVTQIDGEQLKVVFFGPGTSFYDGTEYVFAPDEFEITRVSNSFGHRELRYKVKLTITLKGRTIKGAFTLANRENKLYPVLIGRSLLTNKFLVDVAAGNPLKRQEHERRQKLHEELITIKEVSE